MRFGQQENWSGAEIFTNQIKIFQIQRRAEPRWVWHRFHKGTDHDAGLVAQWIWIASEGPQAVYSEMETMVRGKYKKNAFFLLYHIYLNFI